jgi:hypothetical protein
MDIRDQILELVRNVMGDENFRKAEDSAKTERFYEEMKARLEKEYGPSEEGGQARGEFTQGASARKETGNPLIDGFMKNFEELLKKCKDLPSLEAAVKDFLSKLEAAAKIFRS